MSLIISIAIVVAVAALMCWALRYFGAHDVFEKVIIVAAVLVVAFYIINFLRAQA